MNLNDCSFYGKFAHDPELTRTPSGNKVVNFKFITNRKYKRANGEPQVEMVKLSMEAWDSGAERICETFRAGDFAVVKCSAKNSSWTDREGIDRETIVFRVEQFYPVTTYVGD